MKNKEAGTGVLTVGEIIDELKTLPKQAEVRFTDVCGNFEAELYSIEIDADRGIVLIIGDENNGNDS